MLGNSKQIAELQEKISKLEADLQAATADKTAIQAELDKDNVQLAGLLKAQKMFTRLKGQVKTLRAALVKAADGEDVTDDPESDDEKAKKAKKKAEGEEDDMPDEEEDDKDASACVKLVAKLTSKASVDKQVTQRLAAAGVDPVKRDPAASAKEGDHKPQADASAPPRQRAVASMKSWSVFSKN